MKLETYSTRIRFSVSSMPLCFISLGRPGEIKFHDEGLYSTIALRTAAAASAWLVSETIQRFLEPFLRHTDRLHPAPSVSHATNPTCVFAHSRPIVLERHDATCVRNRSSSSRLAFADLM